MEILFVWFYKEKIIEEQGFNFSPEYEFKVKKNGEKYVLTCNHKDNINIFKLNKNSQAIQNITAIVGENGSGKTSLLQGLYKFYLPRKRNIKDSKYEDYIEEQAEINRKIIVIKESDEIKIYYNMQQEYFENKTNYNKVFDNDIDPIRNFTKIYCTNSNYSYECCTYGKEMDLSECALNLEALEKILSKNFYKKLISVQGDRQKLEYWKFYNESIINNKKANEFQGLCDVLYYKYLEDNKYTDNSLIIHKDLHVSVKTISKEIAEIYLNIEYDSEFDSIDEPKEGYTYREEYENRLKRKIIRQIKSLEKINIPEIKDKYKNFISALRFNWLVEIILYNGTDVLEYLSNDLKNIMGNEYAKLDDGALKEYFMNAIHEIEKLEEILEKSESIKQTLPIEDGGYKFSRVIKKSNKELYREFLNFIDECFNKKHSFILKYIDIGNLKMSSGERACLNIFSWIHLIPQFNKIDPSIPDRLRENVLILIDELDLYMHPEWQRKAVNILINEFENQFKDYNVQIVLATHSPIILSDIPNDNIIFMSKNKTNDSINSRTFGANIYNLYREKFFFNEDNKYLGIIGEFASNKIEYVIKTLNKCEKESFIEEDKNGYIKKLYECKKIIDLIGEPLIRNMLENKYKMVEKKRNLKEKSNELNESIKNFNNLSEEDKKEFLKHIIDKYK